MKGEVTTFEPPRALIDAAFATASAAEIVLAAQQYLKMGLARSAVMLCEAARERGLSDHGLSLSEAMARFSAGERLAGLALVDALLVEIPENLGARSLKAHMAAALGNGVEARALLGGVISDYGDYPGALGLLAALSFPGPAYRDVLARVHRVLSPDTYLEIGVDTGATLALAKTASLAVGVDPEPSVAEPTLASNARLYRCDSDAFFGRETRGNVFGGRAVDLTFIDGMHWFEFALRDFANAERWSTPGSTIVLHDCVPIAPAAATRERGSSFWVGDVWKVLEALLDYRPELTISIVPTAPSGLVIVRGLDPKSTVLFASYEEIVSRYRDLDYRWSAGNWPERYRFVENSDAGLRQALAP